MNIPIYDGCPNWVNSAVPFGFYNADDEFKTDAVKVAKFCAARLGYPLVDIELQSGSFLLLLKKLLPHMVMNYTRIKLRDNQLSFEGLPLGQV